MSRVTLFAASLLAAFGMVAHAETRVPAPVVTLYPGDVISDAVLADITLPYALPADAAVTDRSKIVGKTARRTLLPGKPIPVGALDEARVIANGAAVRLLFEESGLSIIATGQAMQPGTRGEFIRVRNTESGVIVTGTVQADGSVKVGG